MVAFDQNRKQGFNSTAWKERGVNILIGRLKFNYMSLVTCPRLVTKFKSPCFRALIHGEQVAKMFAALNDIAYVLW